MWYKYKYSSLKRIESWTGRGCDTPRLHQKEICVIILDLLGETLNGETSEPLLGESDDPDPSSKESC